MLTEIWVRFNVYRVYLTTRLRDEIALETVEWIAMGTVVLILTMAIGTAFSGGGQAIGQQIVDTINAWITQWGGGESGS